MVPLREAGEIFALTPMVPVPHSHRWFLGVSNLRGHLHGVVDLAGFLGLKTGDRVTVRPGTGRRGSVVPGEDPRIVADDSVGSEPVEKFIDEHADVIVERSVKSGEPSWPAPLEGVRARRYGDTLLCYGRAP